MLSYILRSDAIQIVLYILYLNFKKMQGHSAKKAIRGISNTRRILALMKKMVLSILLKQLLQMITMSQ